MDNNTQRDCYWQFHAVLQRQKLTQTTLWVIFLARFLFKRANSDKQLGSYKKSSLIPVSSILFIYPISIYFYNFFEYSKKQAKFYGYNSFAEYVIDNNAATKLENVSNLFEK